jgi:integrase
MTVARILKRCPCPEGRWKKCPHPWVVRYRTAGGRSSRQRERSFGDDLREAEDFALKIEHDKRARTFVDPKAGQALFRAAAQTWLDQHLGADSSIATYQSVLRAHIDPAIGGKPISAIRREDIKALIAGMHRKGLSASRIGCAHLVISAVLAEAVRDKKLAVSPCTGIQLPGVVTAADFILPAHNQVEAVAAGLAPDWAATVWLMHGCGLRIGEALAVSLRSRISDDSTLRVKEQVNPAGQLRPLKHRTAGEFRDIPLPQYVSEAIDKHAADHGTTGDGYLFQGRKYKLVVRRTYQQDFRGAAGRAGLPRNSSRTRCVTSTPPPPWPRASPSPTSPGGSATRASSSPTRSTATSSPRTSTAPAPPSTPPTRPAANSNHGKPPPDGHTGPAASAERQPHSAIGTGSSQGAQIRLIAREILGARRAALGARHYSPPCRADCCSSPRPSTPPTPSKPP